MANHAEAVDAEAESNKSLRGLDFMSGRISDLHLQRTLNSKGSAERGSRDLFKDEENTESNCEILMRIS